jgi:hypothetical protein
LILRQPDWYERQRQGLAAEFHAEFSNTIGILAVDPFIYPELYRSVRRAVLHRFPYLIWYTVEGSRVIVLACTHGRLNPVTIPQRLRGA